jgi:hypothetical protein
LATTAGCAAARDRDGRAVIPLYFGAGLPGEYAQTRRYCTSAHQRARSGVIAISDHARITVTLRYKISAGVTARSFVTGT